MSDFTNTLPTPETIEEAGINGRQVIKNLDEAAGRLLRTLDTKEQPVDGSTTEITNAMLIETLETLGKLPQGTIAKGVSKFQGEVNNIRGEG